MTNTVNNRRLAAAAIAAGLIALPAVSDAAPSNRIVGGSAVPITSASWQVAILDGGPGPKTLYCGGSLIRPRIVLTAAHCLLSPSPFATHDGSNDLILAGASNRTDVSQGVEDRIASVTINPRFDPTARRDDAAILILDNPVPSTVATPIKLAGHDELPLWAAGRRGTVSGYGATFEGGAASPLLKSTTVPVLKDSYCKSSYPGVFSASTELCAGFKGGGTDACQGDSGGPLIVSARGGDGGFVRQVGIVSFGNGCARPNAPGVYSRVGANPLRAFVQAAVNASPDPGDVIGNGGFCAGFKGRKLSLCKCKTKQTKKARAKCLRKVKHQGHRGRG